MLIEMVNAPGNVIRTSPETVPLWRQKGYRPVAEIEVLPQGNAVVGVSRGGEVNIKRTELPPESEPAPAPAKHTSLGDPEE